MRASRNHSRFVEFIEADARAARALYILGDLFEAWIGDDDDDLRASAGRGGARAPDAARASRAAVMHGNRDFLIGHGFCAATGCRLLGDYERVDLYGETVLLTHGDLLCTDDTRYMSAAGTLRDPTWQREFLAKPLARAAQDRRRICASSAPRRSPRSPTTSWT